MKVKMILPISGMCGDVAWPKNGEVDDLPEAMALDAIESGAAVKVDDDAEVTRTPTWPAEAYETATASEAGVEKRTAKRAARK